MPLTIIEKLVSQYSTLRLNAFASVALGPSLISRASTATATLRQKAQCEDVTVDGVPFLIAHFSHEQPELAEQRRVIDHLYDWRAALVVVRGRHYYPGTTEIAHLHEWLGCLLESQGKAHAPSQCLTLHREFPEPARDTHGQNVRGVTSPINKTASFHEALMRSELYQLPCRYLKRQKNLA